MDLESSCRFIMVLVPFASFFVLYRIDIIGELSATLLTGKCGTILCLIVANEEKISQLVSLFVERLFVFIVGRFG